MSVKCRQKIKQLLLSSCSDCFGSTWSFHGKSVANSCLFQRYVVWVPNEQRAIQYQGACSHNHHCQCWSWIRLCYLYFECCEAQFPSSLTTHCTFSSLACSQGIPRTNMDTSNSHACLVGCYINDASCNCSQLH